MSNPASFLHITELLEGAVDMHVHSAPDLIARSCDDVDLAHGILATGMRAAVIKDHFGNASPRAYLANKTVGRDLLYGTLALNHYVGGFNPYAVEAALLAGARGVWMPTRHAANHLRVMQGHSTPSSCPLRDAEGLSVFDQNQRLLPGVKDIIALVVQHDACLMTGHLSNDEAIAVCREALNQGAQRVIFTHPDFATNLLPVDQQVALAQQGVYMEKTLISLDFKCTTLEHMAQSIAAIGQERCFVSTDYGLIGYPVPWKGMARWVELLLGCGFSDMRIRALVRDVPYSLLGMDAC